MDVWVLGTNLAFNDFDDHFFLDVLSDFQHWPAGSCAADQTQPESQFAEAHYAFWQYFTVANCKVFATVK